MKNVVGLFDYNFCYISRNPEDGTHKDGVENSKLKIVLVCPSTRKIRHRIFYKFGKKSLMYVSLSDALENTEQIIMACKTPSTGNLRLVDGSPEQSSLVETLPVHISPQNVKTGISQIIINLSLYFVYSGIAQALKPKIL